MADQGENMPIQAEGAAAALCCLVRAPTFSSRPARMNPAGRREPSATAGWGRAFRFVGVSL